MRNERDLVCILHCFGVYISTCEVLIGQRI